jgi:hypothetical protein
MSERTAAGSCGRVGPGPVWSSATRQSSVNPSSPTRIPPRSTTAVPSPSRPSTPATGIPADSSRSADSDNPADPKSRAWLLAQVTALTPRYESTASAAGGARREEPMIPVGVSIEVSWVSRLRNSPSEERARAASAAKTRSGGRPESQRCRARSPPNRAVASRPVAGPTGPSRGSEDRPGPRSIARAVIGIGWGADGPPVLPAPSGSCLRASVGLSVPRAKTTAPRRGSGRLDHRRRWPETWARTGLVCEGIKQITIPERRCDPSVGTAHWDGLSVEDRSQATE